MVEEVFKSIEQLRSEISILIIEHHLDIVLSLADRAVVLDRGRVSHEGPTRAAVDGSRVPQEGFVAVRA